MYPRFFAVPCQKWYETDDKPISNKTAHLVLYMTRPQTVQKTIQTRDQFSPRVQQAYHSVLFAAPTIKKDWKPFG